MRVTKLEMKIMEDGRSKTTIARECGFVLPRLSEYIKGKDIPTGHLLVLSDVLRCAPSELLGYTELPDVEMAW